MRGFDRFPVWTASWQVRHTTKVFRRLAAMSGVPESVDLTTSGGIVRYYYVSNGHGDLVALVDSVGTVVASSSYDAFGNLTSSSESLPNGWSNPYRYDGAEGVRYDSETGLYWLSVRAYDPTLGRFLSHDPLGRLAAWGVDFQPYVYASNNPVVNTDPSGLLSCRVLLDGACPSYWMKLANTGGGGGGGGGCTTGCNIPSLPNLTEHTIDCNADDYLDQIHQWHAQEDVCDGFQGWKSRANDYRNRSLSEALNTAIVNIVGGLLAIVVGDAYLWARGGEGRIFAGLDLVLTLLSIGSAISYLIPGLGGIITLLTAALQFVRAAILLAEAAEKLGWFASLAVDAALNSAGGTVSWIAKIVLAVLEPLGAKKWAGKAIGWGHTFLSAGLLVLGTWQIEQTENIVRWCTIHVGCPKQLPGENQFVDVWS